MSLKGMTENRLRFRNAPDMSYITYRYFSDYHGIVSQKLIIHGNHSKVTIHLMWLSCFIFLKCAHNLYISLDGKVTEHRLYFVKKKKSEVFHLTCWILLGGLLGEDNRMVARACLVTTIKSKVLWQAIISRAPSILRRQRGIMKVTPI